MGSDVAIINESAKEMIYEVNHIFNCDIKLSEAMILAVMNAIKDGAC